MDTEYKLKEKNLFRILVIVIVLIISLWIINYFVLIDLKPDERGTIGDMFGTVNALFSGLAFAGIVYTVLLQRIELGYQRDELKETRKEFQIQNETLKLQRFENTFFNLLSLHHQIVDSIDSEVDVQEFPRIEKRKIVINGRDVFKNKYENLKQYLSNQNTLDNINDVYMKFYPNVQTDFGHYFRNLYRMIKLVDESVIIKDDEKKNINLIYKSKYKYTSIIRSQLSDYELLWLFYNCLSTNGYDKFRPLIEKYTLFKNLPKDKLAKKEHVMNYDNFAFTKRDKPEEIPSA